MKSDPFVADATLRIAPAFHKKMHLRESVKDGSPRFARDDVL
jgi:hypothetical protein